MSKEDENGVSRWWLREPVDHADAEADRGGDFVLHSECRRVVDAIKDELAGTIKVREQAFEKIAEMTAEITRLTALVNRLTEDNATEYLLGRRDEVAMKDTIEAWMPGRIKEHEETITRLKADVTNRDAAIERMRRESPARVMGAHMDRVEGALGFPPDKPIIIDMVIARIEQLNAALARVRGQRDKALINYFWLRKAHYEESIEALDAIMALEYDTRIVGGTVEEIES